MNYTTLEKYCPNYRSENSYECYKYTENLPRSTFELQLTPNGAIPNNPDSDSKRIENFIPTTQTDNQPYSYGYPYAEYKWNLYNYYPKTNMSGVV